MLANCASSGCLRSDTATDQLVLPLTAMQDMHKCYKVEDLAADGKAIDHGKHWEIPG